jgi:D-glycero-alpha-D-manno-heptose-7-phosphate kinase
LRLGFAGGGTDVSPYRDRYGGFVMNATIGLYAYAHITRRSDECVRFNACDVREFYEGAAETRIAPEGESLLHKGVYNRIVRDFFENRPLPVEVTTAVEAPAGSGLGSSSALVVALVSAYRQLLRLPLNEYDVAGLAFDIERNDLHLAGGAQDQYSAAFGGFNFIEFYDQDRVVVNPLRVSPRIAYELESSLVLFYTGRARQSAEIIKRQQSNLREERPEAVEAMHVMKREAVEIKEAILHSDIHRIAETLNNGWEAKKRTAAGVSTPEIDALIDDAVAHGAYAAKLSGAGGGGFLFLLVDPVRRPELIARLASRPSDGRVLPCHFTQHGVEAWDVQSPPRAAPEGALAKSA